MPLCLNYFNYIVLIHLVSIMHVITDSNTALLRVVKCINRRWHRLPVSHITYGVRFLS